MLKKGLLLMAASAVSVSAFAGGMDQAPAASQQDNAHAYAGAQVGYVAHYGFDKKTELASNGVTIDQYAAYAKEQGDFGARVFGGYMFDKYLGFEVGVGTFGSQKVAFAGAPAGASAKGTPNDVRSAALIGVDAGLVGNMPLTEQLFVFGKAGMAYVDFQTKGINGYSLASDTNKVYSWNWMPRAELGLGYEVAANTAVTVSYAHYFGINGSERVQEGSTAKSSIGNFGPSFGVASIGLTYSF